jgi:multidrug efflux pump subunit AcrA (membrane-fusion protein)
LLLVASILCLLLLNLTACGFGTSQRSAASEPTPTPLPTPILPENPVYTVEVGTVVQTLEFTGRASPVLQQELFFETGGNVGEVFVAAGDWVQTGQVLAELDIDDLQQQLSQKLLSQETAELKFEQSQIEAQEAITTTLANLEDAQADLASAETTSANDLVEARASVASAEVSLENAKLSLTITQKSDTVSKKVREAEYEANWFEAFYGECIQKYERGEIDKTRLDLEWNNLLTAKDALETARAEAELALSQAEAQVTQAEESLRQAKVRLSELSAQPSVQEAQDAVEQAQQAHEDAIAVADPESYETRLAVLDLEQIRLDIADIESQIATAQLIAPFDGQILSLNVDAGDSAAAYDSVGVIADPALKEITAELGSDELSQMALNQQAVIVLRNRPGETFYGSVRQLPYPYGGTTVDTGDDTAAHVSIDGQVDLELGELATVSIVLDERQDVLWLPPAAIRTYQGRDFVVVQQVDGSQQRVDILVGIVTEERVEITAGLEAGQTIVGE